MGDNYYNQQYPQGSQQRDPYATTLYPPQPQSGYNNNTYQPPTDEGYRGSPVPPNMQVTQYEDRHHRSGDHHGHRPRSRHGDSSYYDDDRYSDRGGGHYLPPPSPGRRPSSRGSYREKERGHDEHKKDEMKSIGATILGGVAGALIGRKAGHKDILPTVLGGVAGAWGGHKLEETVQHRREKSRDARRGDGDLAYEQRGRGRASSRGSDQSDKKSFMEKAKDRLRSLSRKRTTDDDRDKRSRSIGRRRDDSADSYDSRRSRGHSGRHDSEGRGDRYDRDGRYDRDRDYH